MCYDSDDDDEFWEDRCGSSYNRVKLRDGKEDADVGVLMNTALVLVLL
jgi:hypothetical protein